MSTTIRHSTTCGRCPAADCLSPGPPAAAHGGCAPVRGSSVLSRHRAEIRGHAGRLSHVHPPRVNTMSHRPKRSSRYRPGRRVGGPVRGPLGTEVAAAGSPVLPKSSPFTGGEVVCESRPLGCADRAVYRVGSGRLPVTGGNGVATHHPAPTAKRRMSRSPSRSSTTSGTSSRSAPPGHHSDRRSRPHCRDRSVSAESDSEQLTQPKDQPAIAAVITAAP
jgi:hypothetical protein